MSENKTKIIVSRRRAWLNRLRPYQVTIDDKEAGFIKNDSSEEFMVLPGEHVVVCRMNWLSSPSFSVQLKQDEIAYIKVSNSMRFYFPLLIVFALGYIISYSYSINKGTRPPWAIWAQLGSLAPFFLYALYYVTLGRNKYLVVEEDSSNVFKK